MIEHDAAIAPRHAGHVVGIELVGLGQPLCPCLAHGGSPDGAFFRVLRQHGGMRLFRRGKFIRHEEFPPVGDNSDVPGRFQQFIGCFGGCGRGPVLDAHGRARPRDLRRHDQGFTLSEHEGRKVESRIHNGAVAFRFLQELAVTPGHGCLEGDKPRRFPDGFGAHKLNGGFLFAGRRTCHFQQSREFGGIAVTRPGGRVCGNMDGKVLPGTVFPVRCVMGYELSRSLVGAVGGSRSVDDIRRHGRGIDDFALSDGAAGQTGAEQQRQNQPCQLLGSGFFGHINLKTLAQDIHHARGVAHDHDAGNQQCQKAASTENNAGRGQVGGGKAVLKTVPKSFLITFHVDGSLTQIK